MVMDAFTKIQSQRTSDYSMDSDSDIDEFVSEDTDYMLDDAMDYEANELRVVSELPEGWYRGGSYPGKYRMGLDERVFLFGSASAFIQSTGVIHGERLGFGTVCQSFFPKDYLSKRVCLSAWLRYDAWDDNVSWAGIWLKVEFTTENGSSSFRLDNMSDRKLMGSSQGKWLQVTVVSDIPATCTNCTFGFLLFGGGHVWADNFQFDVVPTTVPLTGFLEQKHNI